MQRQKILDWVKKTLDGMKDLAYEKMDDAGKDKFAKRCVLKIEYKQPEWLGEIIDSGQSKSADDFLKNQLKRKPISKEEVEWIKERISEYKKPELDSSGFDDEFKRHVISSETKQMAAQVELEEPENLKQFVERKLELRDRFSKLHMVRWKLWDLDPEDDEVEALYRKAKEIMEQIEELDPKEYSISALYFNDLHMDFGAFISKGNFGSISSVYRVQAKYISKILAELSEIHDIPLLQKYEKILLDINFNSRGALFSVFFFASGRTDSELIPKLDTAREVISKELSKFEEPDREKVLTEFESICKLAEENLKLQ